MPPTHRVRPPLRRVAGEDSGFTLVEALVSLTLLGVVSAATVTALAASTTASKNSGDRLTAANLAQQDLQAMQSLRAPDYPTANPSCNVVVGGTTYVITRTVTDYEATPTATPTPTAAPTTAPASSSVGSTSSSVPVSSTATATGSATTGSTTAAPTGGASTSPSTSASNPVSGTPTPTPTTTAPPRAPRRNFTAPSICLQPTKTPSAKPTPTGTSLAPCPSSPNYDSRQFMIVTTTVTAANNVSVSLKALIAC